MNDRTVHHEGGGFQIVRYDRSGKWYIERVDEGGTITERTHVDVKRAALAAKAARAAGDGRTYLGRHGGRTFDRLTS